MELTLDGLVVITEILLAADENDGETLAEVQNLGNPLQTVFVLAQWLIACVVRTWASRGRYCVWAYLLLHVVQGIRRVNSKADQDDVGIGV